MSELINGHKLEEGEIVCPKCNGTGRKGEVTAYGWYGCPKCRGNGYLDWVENIVGKRTFTVLDGNAYFYAENGHVGIGTCSQPKLEVKDARNKEM
jgi:DnaJ-class molecular chaperone